MLIDLQDNQITIYYLKLKGKEYKLILEFPSPIINKKELYEKYNSPTSTSMEVEAPIFKRFNCFDTNCYRKKPIDEYKDRSDSFLITLPEFVYFEDMIIDYFDYCIHETDNYIPDKESHCIPLTESNIIELLIKGNRVGPTNVIIFFPYIDNETFKEKTKYENIIEIAANLRITPFDLVQTLQNLYSVTVILKEKCYINYRIEIV